MLASKKVAAKPIQTALHNVLCPLATPQAFLEVEKQVIIT